MASNEDVFDFTKLNMPTCIWVEFGSIKTVAVVSTGCWSSLMSQDMYERLRRITLPILITKETSKDDKIYDVCGGIRKISKEIHVNAMIEKQSITIKFNIARSLTSDVVLGGEFMSSVKGHFHYGVGAFRWHYEDKMNISYFITNPEDLKFRVADNAGSSKTNSNESGSSRVDRAFKNMLTSMAIPEDFFNKDDSSDEDDDEVEPDDEFLGPLKEKFSTGANASAEWQNVYVMSKELIEVFGGASMAYNGIYWSKKTELNVIFNQRLSNITYDNFHLLAIAKLIQIAKDNKLSHLKIMSNHECTTRIFNCVIYHGIKKVPNDQKFEGVDIRTFRYIVKNFECVYPLFFEYVPDVADVSEMRKLERLIDKRVMDN